MRGQNAPKSVQNRPAHWLDYASDKYEKSFVDDVKQIMPVLKMFLPLPIFWTLFDQKVRTSSVSKVGLSVFVAVWLERAYFV